MTTRKTHRRKRFSKPFPVAAREDRTLDDIVYDSKLEMGRAAEHKWLVRQYEAENGPGSMEVERQVVIPLGEDDSWCVDFVVYLHDGVDGLAMEHAEEVKGPYESETFRRKLRLWKKYGPCPLVILRPHRGGWETETIYGPGKERS